MKCVYCGKETTDDFIKCPTCHSWIPEINKIQTKFYSLIATTGILIIFLVLRVDAISVWGFNIKRVFNDPIAIVLIIAIILVGIIGEITESKLKKLKKGSLF